jgi:hypothetical protein
MEVISCFHEAGESCLSLGLLRKRLII